MKKKLVVAMVALTLVASMVAGCGKKVKCSICGETKSGKAYEVLGEKVDMCDDCHKLFEAGSDLLGL